MVDSIFGDLPEMHSAFLDFYFRVFMGKEFLECERRGRNFEWLGTGYFFWFFGEDGENPNQGLLESGNCDGFFGISKLFVIKFPFSKLSKFPFSNCQISLSKLSNFPFQTVKIFLSKLKKNRLVSREFSNFGLVCHGSKSSDKTDVNPLINRNSSTSSLDYRAIR